MPDPLPDGFGAQQLLRRLVDADPGRPRVTWYGPAPERVELSARTLSNWVAKTANLLVDELDVPAGGRVGIDLPGHWRTVVWLLATLSVAAEPVLGDDLAEVPGAGIDVLVSTRPEAAAERLPARRALAQLVAVALPALATSFGAPLPPGAVDSATEVRLQPDLFDPTHPSGGHELLASALARAGELGLPPGVRLLTGSDLVDAPARWLGPLLLGGSVILHHDLAGLAPDQVADLLAQEQAVLLA